MIKARNVIKEYGDLRVLKGVDLDVDRAEVVSIVGASGAGKSTLLQIIGTLDLPSNPDSCVLELDGRQFQGMNEKERARFRNEKIGFIFQFHQLLPEFSALENVSIPAFIHCDSESSVRKRAADLLDLLRLSERMQHKPSELSGGEQQRVAVARALINSPSIILADEPSGNLDSENARQLHELFFKLRDEFQQTFVIVTHNEDLAEMADRKLHMKDGNILP